MRAVFKAMDHAGSKGVRAHELLRGLCSLGLVLAQADLDILLGDVPRFREALADYAHQIAATAYADADHADDGRLQEAKYELTAAWETTVMALVWRHFDPVYDDRVLDRRTMPYAAAARRMLAASLKKHRTTEPTSAETTNAS